MIVHDLNVLGAAIFPLEADPYSIIDPDSVLSFAVML